MRKARNAAAIVLVVAVIGGATAAFAWWSSSGAASGTATTGTAPSFDVTVFPVGGGLTIKPGADPVEVEFRVENNSDMPLELSGIEVKIANSDGTAWASQNDPSKPACTAADFSVEGAPAGQPFVYSYEFPRELEANGGYYPSSAGIALVDNGANQDNCQGLALPVYVRAY